MFSPAYAALLARYASGDRDTAVADVVTWTEQRLRPEITAAATLRVDARKCGDCPAASAWDLLPVRTALLLHGDAALGQWRKAAPARLQESAAFDYARLIANDAAHAAFVRRWLEATVAVHHEEMRWEAALAWAERAVALVPDSAPVHLVVAAIEEMQAALVTPVVHKDPLVDPAGRELRARFDAGREARAHLREAREAARRALAADPASSEARLRLGRIAWRLSEPDTARTELDAVVGAGSPRDMVFLAHLFLGRLDEEAGRLSEAARSYEAALAIRPGSQSAAVALSHARHRMGELAAAREALEQGVVEGGRRKAADPFALYPFSESTGASARLSALRAEIAP